VARGPLHGIPIALKDNIDTAGTRTTAASELFKDRIPSEDAEVVRRLKNAGAILIGKTNLHEFAYGGSSSISYFGPVHNPWALDRIPGGSSGGSAAATAAALCFGSLGTDTAGSIRIPASYCGIVGFKPTYGRVSNRGVVPLSWTLDHVGPLCRTVEDAALMLSVVAGFGELDPSTVETPPPDYSSAFKMQASKLHLGIPRARFFDALDPETAKAVDTAIEVLRKLTATVVRSRFHQRVFPLMRSSPGCGASKVTPTTRHGLRSLRKSIRQPLASGSSGIPPGLRRRLMRRLAVNLICFEEKSGRYLLPWIFWSCLQCRARRSQSRRRWTLLR
jgi:aspartyl-tRNA(Asn)/glutamyl-tRNA(Gln) amidotransferase subunit A